MKREAFELLDFPLDGLRLIEASAGTGKTFSLAGLYLRLLVEKQLDVRNILVMTFTRAATQELRERIRTRLSTAAGLAVDPGRADPENIEHLIAGAVIGAAAEHEPRELIARRLRSAAARMDEATISTIHAFAHQAAQENAFDSGLAFDRGTQVDDAEIHEEAVTDYWRSQVFGQPAAQAQALRTLWASPANLLRDLRPALRQPSLYVPFPSAASLEATTEQARALWNGEHEALQRLLASALETGRLLKSGPLFKAIAEAGGIAELMAQLQAGLAGTPSGFAALPGWLGDLASAAGAAQSVKKAARDDFRPQDLALVQALAELAPQARLGALQAALDAVREAVQRRKQSRRQFSFADMIEALHGAVTDPDRGRALANALHRAWPYALVDEFQDTDPLQYEILRAVYHGRDRGGLIMIGDPKQAIYGFRGGDVYAYLEAARDAHGRYDLDTNFRSTAGVLQGIEALFRGPAESTQAGPFLVPEIRFHPVRCGRASDDRAIVKGGEPLPPITVWSLPAGSHKREEARQTLLDATVTEICRLLAPEDGACIRREDDATPLRPDEIAVLVNTNREAADVQRALSRRGVAAVCLHRASVFQSEQARDLLFVLRAADSAARPEAVRAALATPLFGLRMGDLLALSQNDQAWQDAVAQFQDAHETWRNRGVLALLEPLLQDAAPRLLALEDGERRMTNYLQLAELLARAETQTFGLSGLITWLTAQLSEPESGSETQQLRLESDADLVRIITVHRVKGLQYPVVFVPFTPFLGAKRPDAPWVFHSDTGQAQLDFGLEDGAGKYAAGLENRAESLRLLYVALTRAEQVCYFAWGGVNGAQNSALAWLLHAEEVSSPGDLAAGNAKLPEWLGEDRVRNRLQAYAERAHGSVHIAAPPAPLGGAFRLPAGRPPDGHARTDLPAGRPDWSVFSFSRLVAGGRQHPPATGADDESPDLPGAASHLADAAIPLHGPAFGIAIHQLLEAVDPSAWPAPGVTPGERQRAVVARHLLNAGVANAGGASLLDRVCRLVSCTLHTPLPQIGPLALVPPQRRLVEMEFFLMLGGERIGRMIEAMNAQGYAVQLSPERAAQALTGLMQGFVDLTVEADGRYWIVDYKTNDLGPDASSYDPPALARAVRYGHYDLQYLIYLVALHRHLAQSLPDYHPDVHLGGAQYLFLRGMDGRTDATGIFVDSPPADFIVELDDLFAGRSAAP